MEAFHDNFKFLCISTHNFTNFLPLVIEVECRLWKSQTHQWHHIVGGCTTSKIKIIIILICHELKFDNFFLPLNIYLDHGVCFPVLPAMQSKDRKQKTHYQQYKQDWTEVRINWQFQTCGLFHYNAWVLSWSPGNQWNFSIHCIKEIFILMWKQPLWTRF